MTGGIATGKSTVAARFTDCSAPIFDADVVARQLVMPGEPALADIVSTFGQDMLKPGGELDRRRLREHVFGDAGERRRLEAILHPRVRSALRIAAEACTSPYCILAIPLLAESGKDYAWVDRILVVDAPREIQIRRLTQRDGITRPLAERMLDAQASPSQRLAIADDILDNTQSPEALSGPILRLDRLYRRLAAISSAR